MTPECVRFVWPCPDTLQEAFDHRVRCHATIGQKIWTICCSCTQPRDCEVLEDSTVHPERLVDRTGDHALPTGDVRVDGPDDAGIARRGPVRDLEWSVGFVRVSEVSSGSRSRISNGPVCDWSIAQPVEVVDGV